MANGILTLKERHALKTERMTRVIVPRWEGVTSDVAWAETHLRHAAALFATARRSAAQSTEYDVRMALMHSLQSGYTAFEAGMLRALAILDERGPTSEDWPFLLLRHLSRPIADGRPALIEDEELLRALQGLHGYRIVAMQAYDDFDLDEAGRAVRDGETFLARIGAALAWMRQTIGCNGDRPWPQSPYRSLA